MGASLPDGVPTPGGRAVLSIQDLSSLSFIKSIKMASTMMSMNTTRAPAAGAAFRSSVKPAVPNRRTAGRVNAQDELTKPQAPEEILACE